MELTKADKRSWVQTIWNALDRYQDATVPDDDEWDEICTAMAWMSEEIGVEPSDW